MLSISGPVSHCFCALGNGSADIGLPSDSVPWPNTAHIPAKSQLTGATGRPCLARSHILINHSPHLASSISCSVVSSCSLDVLKDSFPCGSEVLATKERISCAGDLPSNGLVYCSESSQPSRSPGLQIRTLGHHMSI